MDQDVHPTANRRNASSGRRWTRTRDPDARPRQRMALTAVRLTPNSTRLSPTVQAARPTPPRESAVAPEATMSAPPATSTAGPLVIGTLVGVRDGARPVGAAVIGSEAVETTSTPILAAAEQQSGVPAARNGAPVRRLTQPKPGHRAPRRPQQATALLRQSLAEPTQGCPSRYQ